MSFEGIESFLMFRILAKDVKDLLPRKEGLGGAYLSWVRWGKGAASDVGVLCHSAPHWLGCFHALPSTTLHPLSSLFPQGQRRAQRHGECCEECVSPAGNCSYNGIVRYQDEMWKGLACEFCVCDHGQVTCQTGECAKVECAQVRSTGISTWSVRALY